jgi:tetratricopeptide (TPR) repeat protein
MTFKKYFFLLTTLLTFLFWACSSKNNDTEAATQKADSLSIKLNSPELKAVNAKLIEDPSNAELYNERAKVYLSLRQFEEASNDAKRALRLDSGQAAHFLTLADVHFSQNETRQAKDLLERAAKIFPENTEALLKLSELYFLVQQYQKSIDFANQALKVNVNLAKAYYLKGSVYKESGDTAKAISSLVTAIDQDAKLGDAHLDLAIIYAARKNPLAFDYYNNSLSINPGNFNARYGRAKLLQDLGRTDAALKEYEELIKLNPQCDYCYYNRGAVLLEIKKDPGAALKEFTKAIEINPNYVEAYFARGYTYSKLKDKQSAKADYQMCLKIQPNYDPAVEELNRQ